jgi:hypothetical protein
MVFPVFPQLPLPPKTDITFNTDLKPYQIEFIPGQKVAFKNKDLLPSQITTAEASFYTDDLETVENFLKNRQGYPFGFYGHDYKNYMCIKYTVTYVSENKGNITLSLVEYTNPSFE